MPRWLPAVVVVSVVVLLGVAVKAFFFPPTNPRITQANFQRIKAGMRREEVEAILGSPGDYRTGPVSYLYPPLSGPSSQWPQTPPLKWWGDEAQIIVWVDHAGVVLQSSRALVLRGQVGMMDWLSWRRHRLRNQEAP
jgi:hypothetical protein